MPSEHRPPHDDTSLEPTANGGGLERRVCPNCREYWDAAPNSDTWFCSIACRKRHERGDYWA